MKLFISWSGGRSKALAEALAGWIPKVIQTVECFYSDDGIRAGARWNNEINAQLEFTDFGILCITPENVSAPWLHYEAGALAKRVTADSRVVPVTLGFGPAAITPPLNQFNGVESNEQGIRKLVKAIVEVADANVDVDSAFEVWWPRLRVKIESIPVLEEEISVPQPPDTHELITEILGIVQGIAREPRGYSAVIPEGVDLVQVGWRNRKFSPGEAAAREMFEHLADAVTPTRRRDLREQSLARAIALRDRLDPATAAEADLHIELARESVHHAHRMARPATEGLLNEES